MKFVQHLKESNRKVSACHDQCDTFASLGCLFSHSGLCLQKAQNQDKNQEEKPTSNGVTEKLGEDEGDEDEHLLQEFEEEMTDLSVPSDKIEEIKEEMQKEFDNIINEVDQETSCVLKFS